MGKASARKQSRRLKERLRRDAALAQEAERLRLSIEQWLWDDLVTGTALAFEDGSIEFVVPFDAEQPDAAEVFALALRQYVEQHPGSEVEDRGDIFERYSFRIKPAPEWIARHAARFAPRSRELLGMARTVPTNSAGVDGGS